MDEQSIGALASQIVNPWAWWQKALANPAEIGKSLPVHDGDAQQGYYRAKNKDKTFDPVAIFYPEGSDKLVAYRKGKDVDAGTIWSFCCRHPVSYEAYLSAMSGKGWPDDDKTVAEQINAPAPTIGDNSGDVSQVDEISDQIEAALAGMSAYVKIDDDATAKKALSLRNRLNELSNQADKIRKAEKEPHLAAGKAVDEMWQPLVKKAKAGADEVRNAIGAWETEKYNRQREAERKAEEARIAAERAAREEEGETAVLDAPKVETQPAPPAEPIGQVQATYGKAASVSVKTVVDQITDYPKLAVYMSQHPELQELLRKLAQRALDAGRTNIPGITTKEEAKVR